MKSFALYLVISLYCPLAAWGQSHQHESGETDRRAQPAAAAPAVVDGGAYVSGMFGNGRAHGGNTSGDKDMKWRSVELRFGKELDPATVSIPALTSGAGKVRLDFVHFNEGHPDNNHRDGFGAQLVYSNAWSGNLTAELGAGPYLSMNTTDLGGGQINDSNLGLLLSLALRIRFDRLDRYSQGLHMRIGLNQVAMRGVHSSTALLVGIGKHFGVTPPYPATGSWRNPVWVGAAIANSITNQSDTEHTTGFSLEAKQYRGRWAASIAAIVEGDDESRVDRQGIAAQAWFAQPLTEKWTVSAGIGPYFAKNDRASSENWKALTLITFQADRYISKDMKVFASFSRVATFRDRNDRDLFRIGVMKQFGGG